MVQVTHRRVDIRMSHPRLDLNDGSPVDGERPKGIAKVVEPELTDASAGHRLLEASSECGGIEVLTRLAAEHQVFPPAGTRSLGKPCEGLSDLRRHRHCAAVPRLRCDNVPM